jgi:hypothetical protein
MFNMLLKHPKVDIQNLFIDTGEKLNEIWIRA